MKRPLRILLNATVNLSLALCIITAALCVVSTWYDCKAVAGIRPYALLCHSRAGEIALNLITDPAMTSPLAAYATASRVKPTDRPLSTLLGSRGWSFAARHDARPRPGLPPTDFRILVVPHWFLGLLFALPFACRRWSRRRPPPAAHLCPACHYDLRATPNRCPECGTIPTARRDTNPG